MTIFDKTGAASESAEGFGMTELAEMLALPSGADLAKALAARIDALREELDGKLSRSLPPDEFRKYDAIRASLVAAHDVLLATRAGFPHRIEGRA